MAAAACSRSPGTESGVQVDSSVALAVSPGHPGLLDSLTLPPEWPGSRTGRKMWPVGWEALGRWGEDAARIEPLAGGVANDVWSVRVDGQLAVGRLGTRSDADLAWETGLLRYLDRAGLTVPVPIPTTDGRLFADGLVVMTYLEGGPPETQADWRRVAGTLRELHRLTQGWPQRPGWRSSTDLLHAETGTKIDLGAMPAEGVARCRAAWARLIGRPTCVVHGNPANPGNVRMTAHQVALIDWDESHVDVPDSTSCCPTTPPASTTAPTTSPRRRRPPGRPPSAGTTRTQSGGSPKSERSDDTAFVRLTVAACRRGLHRCEIPPGRGGHRCAPGAAARPAFVRELSR